MDYLSPSLRYARRLLVEEFLSLPSAIDHLKNRHELDMYVSVVNNSRTETEKHFFPAVEESFGPSLNSDHIKTNIVKIREEKQPQRVRYIFWNM